MENKTKLIILIAVLLCVLVLVVVFLTRKNRINQDTSNTVPEDATVTSEYISASGDFVKLGKSETPETPETPEEIPEEQTEKKKRKSRKQKGKVFHVADNVFTYEEAEPLCKSMNASLADYDQMVDAYKDGADWCSYGWIQNNMAVFPTQKKTWEKLQTGPKKYHNQCGSIGINGGVFKNKKLKFGVNCFGKPPHVTRDITTDDYFSKKLKYEAELQKYFKENQDKYTIFPTTK